jgi:hypothetical protein
VTVYRWVQRFAPEFAEAARSRRHAVGDRWHLDETYLKVRGKWRYLFRAIDFCCPPCRRLRRARPRHVIPAPADWSTASGLQPTQQCPGEGSFAPLRRRRIHRNKAKNGLYAWYQDDALPAADGGGTITVRLRGNDEDERRHFNRTENVRAIPASDPDFLSL